MGVMTENAGVGFIKYILPSRFQKCSRNGLERVKERNMKNNHILNMHIIYNI